MDPDLALEIINDIVREKPLAIEDEAKYLVEALRCSIENRITIYDALFIVLARCRGLELVTADQKQARVAERVGVKVILLQ